MNSTQLDPRRLQMLSVVVRCGGVVEAARVLTMTPQALSQQIATLEKSVGTVLFDRSRRRLEPTALARELAMNGERIDAELVAARRNIASSTGQAKGTVRIATFQSAIRWLVVTALPRIRDSAPAIVPEIVETSGEGSLRALRSGEVDLVIDEVDRSGVHPVRDEPARGLVTHVLRNDPYQLVVPAGWGKDIRTLGDALTEPWIAAPLNSACRDAFARLCLKHKVAPKIAHTCLEFPAVLALVEAREGVALIPTIALSDKPSVDVCKVKGLGSRDLVAYQRTSRRGTEPAVDAVIAALRK
jgi:DNA-binding transcriptional LysR family regulator